MAVGAELIQALALLAVLVAWLWREREHARERAALLERLTGVKLTSTPPRRVDRHWTDRKEADAAKARAERMGAR